MTSRKKELHFVFILKKTKKEKKRNNNKNRK